MTGSRWSHHAPPPCPGCLQRQGSDSFQETDSAWSRLVFLSPGKLGQALPLPSHLPLLTGQTHKRFVDFEGSLSHHHSMDDQILEEIAEKLKLGWAQGKAGLIEKCPLLLISLQTTHPTAWQHQKACSSSGSPPSLPIPHFFLFRPWECSRGSNSLSPSCSSSPWHLSESFLRFLRAYVWPGRCLCTMSIKHCSVFSKQDNT